GERKLTRTVVEKLASLYQHDPDELIVLYLSEKVLYELENEKLALPALQAAEEQVQYKLRQPRREKEDEKKEIIKKMQGYFQSQHLVTKAWIFGSFARGDDHPLSDIDLMVRFDRIKPITFFDFAEVAHALELITGKKIDVVEEGFLLPFAQKTAEKDLTLIYG
ncbi:MAG: nucleotidyltransferase domain-containing protein, partial [Saprospiraceae bacterium]